MCGSGRLVGEGGDLGAVPSSSVSLRPRLKPQHTRRHINSKECLLLNPAYLPALTFVPSSSSSDVLDLAAFGVQDAEFGRLANLDFACRRSRHGRSILNKPLHSILPPLLSFLACVRWSSNTEQTRRENSWGVSFGMEPRIYGGGSSHEEFIHGVETRRAPRPPASCCVGATFVVEFSKGAHEAKTFATYRNS